MGVDRRRKACYTELTLKILLKEGRHSMVSSIIPAIYAIGVALADQGRSLPTFG
jgi:hypothetical protein